MMNPDFNQRFFEVVYLEDLDDLKIRPPAVAYVREIGDFYFRHGPEFWFGEPDEPDRWIRAPYSGDRSLILATEISSLRQKALGAISQMIRINPEDFSGNDFGSSYQSALLCALKTYWQIIFVDMNLRAADTEGEPLYDIENGDILIEDTMNFVQGRGSDRVFLQYPFNLCDTKPITDGTPGVAVYDSRERETFFDSHPTRIAYAALARDHVKGETELHVNVHPDSLPRPIFNALAHEWVDDRSTATKENFGQEWEYTISSLIAPTDHNWAIKRFCWAVIPETYAPIKVQSWSWNNPGGDYPEGAEITIELEQPCPIPLIAPQACVSIQSQPYWYPVTPITHHYVIRPIGVYGGYLNETTIRGRVVPRTTKARFGEDDDTQPAGEAIDLYDPASENWSGQKGHNPARGLSIGDYIKADEDDSFYKVTKVSKNLLENPSTVWLNKTTKPLDPATTNVYGVSIGMKYSYYPTISTTPGDEHYRNGIYMLPSVPGIAGIPMVIDAVKGNVIKLAAPLPCNVAAQTRLEIHASADCDCSVFKYYDPFEFQYQLKKFQKVQYDIGLDAIQEQIDFLDGVLGKVDAYYKEAELRAEREWYIPPYGRLIPLKQLIWDSEFDEYGDTYQEVITEINSRRAALLLLLGTPLPTINNTEYLSLLNYGRHTS